jgi:hypothetical protein
MGARVVLHEYRERRAAKNVALDHAKYDWVIADADEALPASLLRDPTCWRRAAAEPMASW